MTRDLPPFAVHLDESVRGDDGVCAMFPLDQNVVGVSVGCYCRVALYTYLKFGEFLAVCLDVVCVSH